MHWVLLSAYRKEPSLSRWGQPQRTPSAAQVRAGVARDGTPAIAHGCLAIETPMEEHHALLWLPRSDREYSV